MSKIIAPTGAGKARNFLILGILCSFCLQSIAQETGEWLSPENWPFEYNAIGAGASPVLLVIEQAGIDLQVIQNDGTVINSPIGRIGPEFLYVESGSEIHFSLSPLYQATGPGQFRITPISLDQNLPASTAQLFHTAGELFGVDSEDSKLLACDMYKRLGEEDLPGQQWSYMVDTLTARCLFSIGQEIPEPLLASLSDNLELFSIQPYNNDWLKAELLYIQRLFNAADEQFEVAFQKAEAAFQTNTELEVAIQHDLAEIESMLGGNAMMLAFIVGSSNSPENREEQQQIMEKSELHLNQSISRATDIGNASILGRAYDLRAGMFFVKEDNLKVIENLLLAKAEIEKTGNPEWLIPILGSIGDFHKRWGELRATQEAYLESLDIIDGNRENGIFADVYHNIGTFYYDLGDFERAREYIEISIELSRATGREVRSYTNSIQLASIHEETGNLQAAKSLNEEMLEFFISMDQDSAAQFWSPYRIMTQSALSRIEFKLGNLDTALLLSQEVMEQINIRDINVATDLTPIYTHHARVLFNSGETEGAYNVLDRAIEQYRNEPIEMVDLLAARMNLLQENDAVDAAMAVAEEVFALIESQRLEFEPFRLGPYWSGRTNAIYTSHIDFLLQQDSRQLAQVAFTVAERARATSLRMRRQEILLNKNTVNLAARQEWINTVSEIQELQGRIESEEDSLDFERTLSEARERYFASHGIAPEVLDLEIQSINTIQEKIQAGHLVMQFIAGPEKFWRFDLRRDSWAVTEVGNSQQIQAYIDAALYELSSPNSSGSNNTSLLSSVLLKDLPENFSAQGLLIAPSSNLNTFPFSALRLGNYYLSDLAPVTVTPTLSEFFSSQEQPPPALLEDRLEIAVLADPAFGDLVNSNDLREDQEQFRSWSTTLARLPATALEARALSKFYLESERLILTGTDANQENFFNPAVRNAKIIHIATHGYFNENLPDLIGFAMAKSNELDDGFVTMAEISAQEFNADLVVISACNTAQGFEIPGEGNMSLARTFLAQGVNSVVSTLWPVSDTATALFMKEFYQAINEDKLSLDRALQKAQSVLKASNRYNNPFYWSGFVLSSLSTPLNSD